MKPRHLDYVIICLLAMALAIPVFMILSAMGMVFGPASTLCDWVFYPSLEARREIADFIGWQLGRGDEITLGILIAEVEFLLIGIVLCVALMIYRRVRGSSRTWPPPLDE